ncbi:MAG: hypothetical protein ACKKL6_01850 [Candidatus Komeilibacteria bacterium]
MEIVVILGALISLIIFGKGMFMVEILNEMTLSDIRKNVARGLGARQQYEERAKKYLLTGLIGIVLFATLGWFTL